MQVFRQTVPNSRCSNTWIGPWRFLFVLGSYSDLSIARPPQPRLDDIRRQNETKEHVLFGRPFVKRFALCYRTVVLPICPICNIDVLWPNGWMDQDATWYGGRPQPRIYCIRWGPSSPTERGTALTAFRPMSIMAKWSIISATAEFLFMW